MTAPDTHTITYLRYRKNRHYLEVDGHKVRVTETHVPPLRDRLRHRHSGGVHP